MTYQGGDSSSTKRLKVLARDFLANTPHKTIDEAIRAGDKTLLEWCDAVRHSAESARRELSTEVAKQRKLSQEQQTQ